MAYPSSGYYKPLTPPKPVGTPLARAATGVGKQADPFGLTPTVTDTIGTPPASAPMSRVPPAPAVGAAKAAPSAVPAVNPSLVAAASTQAAPTPAAYDINTDPSLQNTLAFTGMSDEQAQASALTAKQQALLGYGDSGLASAVLGGSDPTVAAAAANPTSTLAQLGQQRDRNETQLTEGLNQDNLLYSGYRVTQEDQAAQDYQNALATAAANVNGGLTNISSGLSSALESNQAQRTAAEQAAYQTAAAAAAAGNAPTLDLSGLAALLAGGGGDTPAPADPFAGVFTQPVTPDGTPNVPATNAPIAGPPGTALTYGAAPAPNAPAKAGTSALVKAAAAKKSKATSPFTNYFG